MGVDGGTRKGFIFWLGLVGNKYHTLVTMIRTLDVCTYVA